MVHFKILRFLSYLLLPAVTWLFINAAVNRHTHFLSDGNFISHAHPYKTVPTDQVPFKSHHHSKAEILLFSLLTDPASSALALMLFGTFLPLIPTLFSFPYKQTRPFKNYCQVYNYHAPPV